MALNFPSTVSNSSINCGSKSSIDDLAVWTVLMWAYPVNGGADAWIMQKGAAGTGSRHIDIRRAGTFTTELAVYADRATTDMDYVTNTTPVIHGQWGCFGVTFNPNAAAGELVNIYAGHLSKSLDECGYGTATDGAGAFASDAGEDLRIGNYKALAGPFRGIISHIALFRAVLPLSQMRLWQWNPRVLPGCVGYWRLGRPNAIVQLDESGFANYGAVTGATLALPNVPLVEQPRKRKWFYVETVTPSGAVRIHPGRGPAVCTAVRIEPVGRLGL